MKKNTAQLKTIRKYGQKPYQIGILHGGPGAAGEMKPVAENLSDDFGILELLQTEKSVTGQIEELYNQLILNADFPVTLVGYSWGAWLGFLFTAKYPDLIRKLILISSGAFEEKYNKDLMNVRFDRLNQHDKKEAGKLISIIGSGNSDNETLKDFGKLMTIADSFDYTPDNNDSIINLNMEIYQSVWSEALGLRKTKELINCTDYIKCPVVAIHGDYDPHPLEGVEKPLSARLDNFRMVRIEKCGHTPWRERQAKDNFFRILREEIN